MNKPYAEASEQNKAAILEVIRPLLAGDVLEIGSGTGQHAVFFAAAAPSVSWQTSDLAQILGGIASWIEDSGLSNLPAPIELDVDRDWPRRQFDFAFSANCFHIMNEASVERCLHGVAKCLKAGARFAVYGPFNYQGDYTSDSNRRFDQFLKQQDPASGIKDVVQLDRQADAAGMDRIDDVAMPANNRILIWQRRT